jgi:hypothetical protein
LSLDDSAPHGVEVVQNEIINPQYFRNQMRRFFPGSEVDFNRGFMEFFGTTLEKISSQKDRSLKDPNARLLSGMSPVATGSSNQEPDPNKNSGRRKI